MKERPKIQLVINTTDKIFEILGWVLIVVVWIFTIANYSNLPNSTPIHYNSAGQFDALGRNATILILPITATILFITLTLLNKFPYICLITQPI